MEVTAIYKQFHQALLGFILSKIRSHEDAEDILQNVFIRIASSIDKLSEEQKLKPWIFTITRNAIIDYYRANANKKNVAVDEKIADSLVDDNDIDETKGLDKCIGSMIELLPDDYRGIIIDSELKGIKQKDLAAKYDMAYPSMRSRVQRGREKLKQLLYNCCDIETDRRGNIIDSKGKPDCGDTCDPCASGGSI
jgi:RNA polymerase sigma-70 factor, ECF subfamily